MGPWHVQPLKIKVGVGVMALRENKRLPRSPEMKACHQLQLSVLSKNIIFVVVGGGEFYPSEGYRVKSRS